MTGEEVGNNQSYYSNRSDQLMQKTKSPLKGPTLSYQEARRRADELKYK